MLVGERSEPLSRVFNDQPRGIYIYMVASYPGPHHGVPVRGPGNNGLRMHLIKTARYE